MLRCLRHWWAARHVSRDKFQETSVKMVLKVNGAVVVIVDATQVVVAE